MTKRTHKEGETPDRNHDQQHCIVIRCKLFSDAITQHVCEIRQQELAAQGADFSCVGCTARSKGLRFGKFSS